MSRIRSVRWGVPVREDTCPGPSALWGRVASSFPHRFQCFHRVPVCCWVGSEWVINHWLYAGLGLWSSPGWASALTAMLLAHAHRLYILHKFELIKTAMQHDPKTDQNFLCFSIGKQHLSHLQFNYLITTCYRKNYFMWLPRYPPLPLPMQYL